MSNKIIMEGFICVSYDYDYFACGLVNNRDSRSLIDLSYQIAQELNLVKYNDPEPTITDKRYRITVEEIK